jgi:group I intron endonuclease
MEKEKSAIVVLGGDFSKSDFSKDDFNLTDDLHNGQIYLIKNKSNGKCYIGQAMCFTGMNNSRWGTLGRWKSHIREATKSNQDHCVLLNNAIRKYGKDNFEVTTLIKCKNEELDEYEIKFIEEYNSVMPNGYNLKKGGYSSKNNETTILKMKQAHTGKEHSDETKEKIGKSQVGNRRDSKKRIHEEDNNLPKYISSSRRDGILKGYIISRFPIGITEKEYLKSILFSIAKYGTKEKALEEAIICITKLKEEYKFVEEETSIIKEKSIEVSITEKKEKKILDKLPEYIYPILEDNKIAGYYVDNIFNKKGVKYPRRDFNQKTNRWNLDEAEKFVNMLHYINENNVVLKYVTTDDLEVNDIEKAFFKQYYLPMYFNLLRKKGEIIGFCINGFPCDKFKDGKYKKEYRFKTMKGTRTFEETYLQGIEDLYDLKKGYITI